MRSLSFVIGGTATGKTYFIKNHFGNREVEILNVYDYQQIAYNEAGYEDVIPMDAQIKCLRKANEKLLSAIINNLSQGRDVVAEQTLFKAMRRIAYLDKIRKTVEAEIEVFVMRPSDELWSENIRQRNLEGGLERYKMQASILEFPNPAEGFDRIFEVVDSRVIPRSDQADPRIVVRAREELAREAERIKEEESGGHCSETSNTG